MLSRSVSVTVIHGECQNESSFACGFEVVLQASEHKTFTRSVCACLSNLYLEHTNGGLKGNNPRPNSLPTSRNAKQFSFPTVFIGRATLPKVRDF